MPLTHDTRREAVSYVRCFSFSFSFSLRHSYSGGNGTRTRAPLGQRQQVRLSLESCLSFIRDRVSKWQRNAREARRGASAKRSSLKSPQSSPPPPPPPVQSVSARAPLSQIRRSHVLVLFILVPFRAPNFGLSLAFVRSHTRALHRLKSKHYLSLSEPVLSHSSLGSSSRCVQCTLYTHSICAFLRIESYILAFVRRVFTSPRISRLKYDFP